jgi:uracil-DNA glycosylase
MICVLLHACYRIWVTSHKPPICDMPDTIFSPHPAEAARHLLWLAEMGVDEVISPTPIDRFQEKPPAKPVVTPQIRSLPVAPVPSRPAPPSVETPADVIAAANAAPDLAALSMILEGFDAHPLKRTASQLCFVGGAIPSRVLVLTDRPRNEEDRSGRIFAAKHEVLMERMLAAIGLKSVSDSENHEAVGLMSFLPWRPPGNRQPTELECGMIVPIITRAIALAKPSLILAIGHLPAQWLAGGGDSLQRQRGKWFDVNGIPMLATFHPETLLKSPASKRLAWADLLAFRAKLDELS